MNGRERVNAVLNFTHPDRVPRDLWSTGYVPAFRGEDFFGLVERYPLDISYAPACIKKAGYGDNWYVTAGEYVDEWGSTWVAGETGALGEVKQPALADWSKLDHFQPPWDLIRTRDLSPVNEVCAASTNYIISDVTANPFERMQFLRGSENLYLDIGYGTAQFRRLLEMVHEFSLENTRLWCQTAVDGICFMDDWGSNLNLLISPRTWREIFKPLYCQYIDMIHAAGKKVFFHSDGNIQAIYGDLIEIGMDAINSQLFVMDIEELARKYKGKVTFWGEIDRQRILPFGTPEEVRAAVQRVRAALDDGSGGLIALLDWGKNDPLENVEAAFAAWAEDLHA
jgi:uroporphyrinogen decarboxylase